jgi:hypothetical protein
MTSVEERKKTVRGAVAAIVGRVTQIFSPKPTEVKPYCLCCYPDYHKNVNGFCIFDGKQWPCSYLVTSKPPSYEYDTWVW